MTITNLDPKPWILKAAKMRVANPSEWGHLLTGPNDGRHFKYAPRPEFDVQDNPILIAVAAEPDNDWLAWLAEPETDDGSYTLNGRHESFTRKQIKHARAVLERIVVPGNQKES